MTASTNFSSGTVVTKEWLNAVDANVFDYTINVKNYGAVGDGATDDTAAINAAIAAASTKSAKTLYLPMGVYLISSALTAFTKNQ